MNESARQVSRIMAILVKVSLREKHLKTSIEASLNEALGELKQPIAARFSYTTAKVELLGRFVIEVVTCEEPPQSAFHHFVEMAIATLMSCNETSSALINKATIQSHSRHSKVH